MAKIQLGKAPKNFKRKITIELLDGSKGDVEFSFIYRTRSDYAKLMDETLAAEKALNESHNEWFKAEQEKASDKAAKLATKEAEKKQITDEVEIELIKNTHISKFMDELQTVAVEKVVNDGLEQNVKFMKAIADGWDLDDPFDDANVKTLVNEFPAIPTEAKEAYRLAILEGRTKN